MNDGEREEMAWEHLSTFGYVTGEDARILEKQWSLVDIDGEKYDPINYGDFGGRCIIVSGGAYEPQVEYITEEEKRIQKIKDMMGKHEEHSKGWCIP